MPRPTNHARPSDADIPAARLMAHVARELEEVARATEAMHELAGASRDLRDEEVRAAQAIDLNAQLLRDMARLLLTMAGEAPEGWRFEARGLGAAFALDALRRRLLPDVEGRVAANAEPGTLDLF